MNTSDITKDGQCIFNTISHNGIGIGFNWGGHGKITFFIGDGNSWDSGPNHSTASGFQNNVWYHVTLVKDGINYSLYLDGNLDTEKTQFNVVDATSLVEKTYIEVDNEVMFIRKITGNTLLVNRGQYSSVIDIHNSGASVSAINADDNALIEENLGDDFGFSENRFAFNDGRTYSPTKGVDV